MSRILVVDDDPDILETLRYTFEQAGHTVESEGDGDTALVHARRRPPDLAVLDVMLPGLNGYEVSRLLKQEMRAQRLLPFPILMLTARRVCTDERMEFLSSWSQADDTLWKPYDLGVLLLRVQTLLGAARGTAPVGEPS
jgi:two-component system alkaline phosphatase synthesis response regulator PhoP